MQYEIITSKSINLDKVKPIVSNNSNASSLFRLSAIASAIIFGLIHAFNFLMGVELLPAVIQAVTNVGIGLFFASVYLRGGNFWSLVLIHTVVDLNGLFKSTFCYVDQASVISSIPVTSLIAGVVFIAISIFLLRPSKCKEIVERFTAAEPKKELIENA